MEQREVTVIKARPKFELDKNGFKVIKKRVAAYARVSTDSDEQINSYKNQLDEYTKKISSNPEWEYVGVFADEGISGTSANKRVAFNQMIRKAKAGDIDLILTKSVSRMARNTELLLRTIRELKEKGVEIIFEKENLSSFDSKTELVLSLMSSIAQEESRSISENVNWTIRKNMKDGNVKMSTYVFLGFDRDKDGNLVVVEEEAKIIRQIYQWYTNGVGPNEIKRRLEAAHIKTGAGKDKWHLSTIQSILRNEKYKGDVLLQKTFTIDYLTHKAVKNRGQVPSYYVTNSHEPIIDPDMWERVQERIKAQSLKLRGANRDLNKYNTRYPLSGMLICNECGETYKRRQWISGYKVPKIMYQCNRYIEPKLQERCHAKPISENLLLVACAQVINELFLTDSKVFAKIANVVDEVFQPRGASTTLTDKIAKKEELEKTINLLLSERANATSLETRTLLDKQYVDACDEYSLILKEIEHLQDKEQAEINLAARYKRVKALIDGKQITPEMITKDILDVFLYRIIVVR